MGTVLSKTNKMRKRAGLTKKSVFKSTLSLNDVGYNGLVQLEVKPAVGVWGVIETVPQDKWMRHCSSFGFHLGPICSHHTKGSAVSTWSTSSCSTRCPSVSSSSLVIHRHSEPEESIPVDSFLAKALQDGTLEYSIPCSDSYHTFYFSFDSLSDTKHFLIYASNREKSSSLTFFIEKSGTFKVLQCDISADESRIALLMLPLERTEDANVSSESYDVQIYSKRPAAYDPDFYGNMFEMENEVPGVLGCNGPPKMLFDKRFMASRLILINVASMKSSPISEFVISLDLSKGRMLLPTNNYAKDIIEECEFIDAQLSTDGDWIFTHVLKELWVSTVAKKKGRAFLIFNTSSLELMKCVDVGFDNMHDCYINYIPAFSRDCQQVALRYKKLVRVYRLPCPQSLQGLCRVLIRNCLSDAELGRIAASRKIFDYLNYKPLSY